MELKYYQEKLELTKENSSLTEQICEMLELFTDLANLKCLSYYEYDYEYNEYIYKFTMNKDGKKIEIPEEHGRTYNILLKKNKITFGRIVVYDTFRGSLILRKLLDKIRKQLEKQREIRKRLYGNDAAFNIYLIHDEDIEAFADNLRIGLKGLFNVDVTLDTSIERHLEDLKSKDTKHIIIYLVSDETKIKEDEDIIRFLNELIIVIGPNDHKISMYCGRLGIENYVSINEFKAENIKSIILETRRSLINKNKFGNKIIGITGISGGLGTTTISMNMADLLAQNLPNKNVLYIDLSGTKAVSNLFLEKNPLPEKTIIDLINSSEFNIETNLENGLIKKRENFYCITGIQKHIDKEFVEKDIFVEKLLSYISDSSDYFNFIIVDLGLADASHLKSTLYDVVNNLWVVTEMTLPHTSKLKTFYSLMKRAGLKEKVSFIVNRYDSENAISVSDVTSILNMREEDKIHFDDLKIPNDYQTLGKCWNYCELASEVQPNSIFIKKLNSILENRDFYKNDDKPKAKKQSGGLFSFFKKSKK